MSIHTTILDLAMAIYDEAVTLVGAGPEADALANAALADMLHRSSMDPPGPRAVQHVPRRARHVRGLRASA